MKKEETKPNPRKPDLGLKINLNRNRVECRKNFERKPEPNRILKKEPNRIRIRTLLFKKETNRSWNGFGLLRKKEPNPIELYSKIFHHNRNRTEPWSDGHLQNQNRTELNFLLLQRTEPNRTFFICGADCHHW